METSNQVLHPIILTGTSCKFEDDCACPDHAFILTFKSRPEWENDCACADSPLTGNVCLSKRSSYRLTTDTFTTQMDERFWLAFSPYAPQGPSVLNSEAWTRLNEFREPRGLLYPLDNLLAEQYLILPEGSKPVAQNAPPETLTAWLHITNACNLECPYCYVRKSSASMSLEIGLRAVERIFAQAKEHGFREVKLKYAGGESTLQFRLLRSLHARAQALACDTGLKLSAVVLSNGTRLRSADADWLINNHVRLMISVDGVKEQHDLMRPQKRGGSSFDALIRTVDNILLPRGIHPFASITVTGWNAKGSADAVRWALERELPVSLNFYRQTHLAPADLALDEATIIDGMLASYAVFEEYLPVQPFLNGLLDRVQMNAHLHTCGVGMNYLVVTHEGKLAQCQMHLDRPIDSKLGENWLPVLSNGLIRNVPVDEKKGCRDCAYRYRCAGGCPLETYRFTGRWDVQSPNCRIYQALLPAALRLEGLRLLKQNGYLQ